MRRNSFRIALLAAGLLTTFLACSSYAAKRSSSGGDGSPITVVIDAGHGGYDRGGIPGQRVSEKDMTLDVARRLKSVLAASGYRVGDDQGQRRLCSVGNAVRNRQLLPQRHFCIRPLQFSDTTGSKRHRNILLQSRQPIARVGDSSLRCRRCAVREAAACVAVVTPSCEGRICRPCSSSAVFSLTRPKLRTLRMLLIVKNLPKRLQPESADAIPSPAPWHDPSRDSRKLFRCNRTSTKPGSPNPKRAGRSVRPRKAVDKRRRLHRNRPR